MYVANWAGNNEENEFYRNDITESYDRNWIVLHLKGTQSNSYGIGAKVRIKAAVNGRSYWQTRWLWPNTGYGSQNEPLVHFGLGNATAVDSLEILWPSGVKDYFRSLVVNQHYEAIEQGNLTPVHTR